MTKEELMREKLEQFAEDLDASIGFESSKDAYEANKDFPTWTPEYKAGYVDGLKRARELLEELN